MKIIRIVKYYFLILLIFITGCSDDSDYITTVKSITFNDGVSVEELVNMNIKAGEFCIENNSNKLLVNEPIIAMLSFMSKEEVKSLFKETRIIIPKLSEIKWEVEGSTKNGKVIIASNDRIKVKISTRKNGDYIETSKNDIKTFIKVNNTEIPKKIILNAIRLDSIAKKYGYKNIEDEVKVVEKDKPFDENRFKNNKKNGYIVEYYSSGRVSFITDSYIEISLEDKSNIKNIEENINWLKKNINSNEYRGENINSLVDFSYEIEYQIIAEKLNKNLSIQDKKKIADLEKKALNIFNILQKEVNKIN